MRKILKKLGFTLVELIVVIAIIGVLAAILIPTMVGYVTQSRVTSANATAKELQNELGYFLTQADIDRYGMFISSTNAIEANISVTNKAWTITFESSVNGVFKTGGVYSWTGSGTGSIGTPYIGTNAETYLAVRLAEKFPTVDTAYCRFRLEGNRCVALYFTTETNAALANMETFAQGGWANETFAWDGQNAGIIDGFVVGTSPVLQLG